MAGCAGKGFAGRPGEARPGAQVETLAMWPLARGTGVRGEGRVWKTRVNSLWKIDLLDRVMGSPLLSS